MMTNKVTKKDMYNAIKSFVETGVCEYDKADVVEFCDKEIANLDKKALKAKERAAKKALEGDALRDLVKSVLTDEFKTIADITADVAQTDPEATVAKVTYRLTQLFKENEAEKSEVEIVNPETNKKRKVVAYKIAD